MNLKNTREAIHEAFTWGHTKKQSGLSEYLDYLTQIQKSGRDNNQSTAEFVEAAYILAAVSSLPPHIGGWLEFAYGFDDSQLIQLSLAARLRDLFRFRHARQNHRYLALAMSALEDQRIGYWQRRRLPVVVYAERIGCDPDNFQRDFSRPLKKCTEEITGWDRDGIGQVSRVVRSLRGESDYQASEELADIAAMHK